MYGMKRTLSREKQRKARTDMFGLFLCGQLLPHLSVLYWMHEGMDGGVIAMKDYSVQNKRAWEYNAYDFWVRTAGSPAELAARVMADPMRSLKRYARYFDAFEGVRVANICGSCGKKALPLALLGAEVTVFDISEDNRRYALEATDAVHVTLGYEVGDVLDVDLARFGSSFDMVFMEGGVLHYFHDLENSCTSCMPTCAREVS